MKNILKVTILFCLLIAFAVIPAFADTLPVIVFPADKTYVGFRYNNVSTYVYYSSSDTFYGFFFQPNTPSLIVCSENSQTVHLTIFYDNSLEANDTYNINNRNGTSNLYYANTSRIIDRSSDVYTVYSTFQDGMNAVRDYIDNPPPAYSKNPNVDEFIANTLISMGVKFDTPAYALSYASDAWDWCIDETNMESAHPFDEWNIESFVSYCNAQSNNYLNWYNGYKVSEDVTKALGEYVRQNIRSLTGLPEGITSLTGAYLPIYHYGSGFQSGVSSPTAQTFYPAQTITYFNGEYVNETDDISTSQFLYSPADVRRFLGYPATSSIVIPSDPAAGTGTITDDPNNPDQKNIEINFPSLDWLADAINSILDFLRNALTTLADLLTQLLDAILGLFSDAFASLADFGQGIIDFLQSVFAGLSTLLNGYVPSDLAVIIACFIALNFGIGLITFILKGH